MSGANAGTLYSARNYLVMAIELIGPGRALTIGASGLAHQHVCKAIGLLDERIKKDELAAVTRGWRPRDNEVTGTGGALGDRCMTKSLTFDAFSAANLQRCESPEGFNHRLSDWSPSDWMTATMGELGEAANVVKKLNRIRDNITGNQETHDELMAKLRRELGDTFVYLDLFCQSLGFSIADAAIETWNAKSKQIGYPHEL